MGIYFADKALTVDAPEPSKMPAVYRIVIGCLRKPQLVTKHSEISEAFQRPLECHVLHSKSMENGRYWKVNIDSWMRDKSLRHKLNASSEEVMLVFAKIFDLSD